MKWISNRKLSVPLIGIAVLVGTFLASLRVGSDYHQSTWNILVTGSILLLAYIALIVAARIIERRRKTTPQKE